MLYKSQDVILPETLELLVLLQAATLPDKVF
jgi:hypothetical protein